MSMLAKYCAYAKYIVFMPDIERVLYIVCTQYCVGNKCCLLYSLLCVCTKFCLEIAFYVPMTHFELCEVITIHV